jgi:hypothetical protein
MSSTPEGRFKKHVIRYLKTLPNTYFFVKEAAAIRGIPDIIGCMNGRYFALELKKDLKETQKLTGRIVLQREAIRKTHDAGGIGCILSPEFFNSFAVQFPIACSKWEGYLSTNELLVFIPKT